MNKVKTVVGPIGEIWEFAGVQVLTEEKNMRLLRFAGLIIIIILSWHVALSFADDLDPRYRFGGLKPPASPYKNTQSHFHNDLFTGSAGYEYKIKVPPGVKGLQPDLSLSYNSHAAKGKAGWVGAGWQVPLSYIQRDINFTRKDTSDDKFELYLEGAKHDLVYVAAEGLYHTKNETYMRVEFRGSGAPNDKGEYWVVYTKDGTEYRFGYNPDAETPVNTSDASMLPPYVWRWSLDRIKDSNGNCIFFTYSENPTSNDKGAVYLSKIEYNNEKKRLIEFILEGSDKPDAYLTIEQGSEVREARRLSEISISVNGQLARKYKFTYALNESQTKSLLTAITEYGSDGVSALPSTRFEYKPLDKGFNNEVSWYTPGERWIRKSDGDNDVIVDTFDVNGDGLPDLVSYEPYHWDIWLNTKTGFSSSNLQWGVPGSPDGGWDIRDIESWDKGNTPNTRSSPMDLNGDGHVDFLWADGNSSLLFASNFGVGFGGVNTWSLPTTAWIREVQAPDDKAANVKQDFFDVNGDGLPDLVKKEGNGWHIWRNTGSGFVDYGVWPVSYTDGKSWLEDFTRGVANVQVTHIDINGDGLPDIVDGNSGTWRIYLNTGSNFIYAGDWPTGYSNCITDLDSSGNVKRDLIDINGDGLPDVVNPVNGSYTWEVQFNTGHGFTPKMSWSGPTSDGYTRDAVPPGGDCGEDTCIRRDMFDIDGDGVVDVVRKTASDWKVYTNKSGQADLLTKITEPLGGLTTILYGPSVQYNNSRLPFNYWVVTSLTKNNGMSGTHALSSTTSLTYSNGLYDFPSREFRGFGEVIETRPDSTKVFHIFHQEEARKGKEIATGIRNSGDTTFTVTENTYSTSSANGVYTSYLMRTDEYTYDGNLANPKLKRTQYYDYDQFGNAGLIIDYGDVDLSGDETYTYYEYWPTCGSSPWIVDKAKHTYVTGSAGGSKLRETYLTYDGSTSCVSKGNLTTEEKLISSGISAVTTNTYDAYGNRESTTDAEGRVTSIQYDSTYNTYPTTAYNAKNQLTTRIFNALNGELAQETDPNGFTTRYGYDVFGRKISEVRPYDSDASPTTIIQYAMDGTAPEVIVVSKREAAGGGTLDAVSAIDGFGKLIQTKTESENPANKIALDIYYDVMGRIKKQSNPYMTDSSNGYSAPNTSIPGKMYLYDAVGRPVTITNPDGTLITRVFDHWTVTETDENGHSKVYTFDASQRLKKVVENNTAESYTTNYQFNPLGELVTIIDAAGNTTTMQYDMLGRRTQLVDPDLGTRSYGYDKVGNIISQIDAKGGVTLISYDPLNRKTLVDYPASPDIQFSYDQPTIGTLSQVTDAAGTVSYLYDQRLRKIQETRTMDGRSWTTQWSYDSMDRPISMTYPGGEVVTFNYNSQGKLFSIPGIVSGLDYNAGNQLTNKVYGNSKRTTYTYHSQNQRLTGLVSSGLQNFSYTYDNVGNIKSIVDAAVGRTENYTYDNLDRLLTAGDSGYSIQYQYNAIGNMTSMVKDGKTTTYTYGTTDIRPHAVTGVSSSLPVLATFVIDNGAVVTLSNIITLNNISMGTPTHYMASENVSFTGASWQPYSTTPSFTLSNGYGPKTVYFKVKNADGESNVKTYSIMVVQVNPESLNFGSVPVGLTKELSFWLQNTGTAILAGSMSTTLPFSVTSGGTYSLDPGQSQQVTVRYSPTHSGSHQGVVTYAGQTATVSLTGTATGGVPVLPGGVLSWGRNDDGQLGDGVTMGHKTPFQVPGLTGVKAIAGGLSHTIALKNDGTVWAWGYNGYGQLGNGTTIDSKVPVQVINLTDVIAVAGGRYHTLALKNDGSVWAWGFGWDGELGNGASTSSYIPVQVLNLTNVIAVAAGSWHSLAVKNDGTVWAWGSNSYGQLGNGTNTSSNIPVPVSNLTGVTAVTSGHVNPFSVALKNDGTVWAWGWGLNGELGNGTNTSSNVPVPVSNLTGVTSVVAGGLHSLALKSDNTVWAWGAGGRGGLGNGTWNGSNIPVQVLNINTATGLAAGYYHSDALLTDKTVNAWGQNDDGQLGDGTTLSRNAPVPTQGISDVKAIAAGGMHTIALKNDGTVWTWGNNLYGQLGDGLRTASPSPGPVQNLTNVIGLSGGLRHSVALKSDKTVWTFGRNENGQLGNGTNVSSNMPAQVPGLADIKAVTAGREHTIALENDGTVWAWGSGGYGQLGNGSYASSDVPVQVSNLTDVITIATGGLHNIALRTDGTVWAWGAGYYGQLGNGAYASSNIPVPVSNLTDVIAISAGMNHSIAVMSDGTVWTWGYNSSGQLGNGTNTGNSLPVQVSNLTGVTAVAGGSSHTLALKNDGTVWSWGSGGSGQLGNGAYISSNVRVQVSNLTNVIAIAGGDNHSMALKSDGTVCTWGSGGWGQMGNGTFSTFSTPVTVPGLASVVGIAAGGDHSLAIGSQIGMGAVTVDPNPNTINAPWTLTGPDGYVTNGTGDRTIGVSLAGSYTVTWGDVAGYSKPVSETQAVTIGGAITFTGAYQPIVGTVAVDPEPNGANASWYLTGPYSYSRSGSGDLTLTSMIIGNYTITWNTTSGYERPTPGQVVQTLTEGQTLTLTGTYQTATGTVTITPEPGTVNAPWTLSGSSGYSLTSSGSATVTGRNSGSYTLTWGNVPGWTKPWPTAQSMSMAPGGTITFSGIYQPAGTLDTWQSQTVGTNHLIGVAYSPGLDLFAAVGAGGTILTSQDGTIWTPRTSGTTNTLEKIAYGLGKYVAVGAAGTILTSTDGLNWQPWTSGTTGALYGVAYGNNLFVVVGQNGVILTSPDGETWTPQSSGTSGHFYGVGYGNGLYVAVGPGGLIVTSPNGITWTSRNSGVSIGLWRLAYGNGAFVATGSSGTSLTSPDGIAWQRNTSNANFSGLAFVNGLFTAVGPGGVIATSPDGVRWQGHLSGVTTELEDVTYGNGKLVVVGRSGVILLSGAIRGSVLVEVTPDQIHAPWSLTGPGGFSTTGLGDRHLAAPQTGDYTLTWGDVSGWRKPTPAQVTQTLSEGGTLTFQGGYYQVSSGTVVINAEPNSINAPWTLTGPNSFSQSGTGDATLIDVDSGDYTLTWGDVTGWIKPSPAASTQTLNADGTVTFTGTYIQHPVTGKKCYNDTVEIPCPAPGQPFYGQDGNYNINPPSYTKLDANGAALPDSAITWAMVRDNVTGLIWENKTDDGGIHDKDNTFTWCDKNQATNGGNQGTCGSGTGNASTDTNAFIKALNDAHYGGFSDWRMPTPQELHSIADYSRPNLPIDTTFFPETVSSPYWSSITSADYTLYAWAVVFYNGGVNIGTDSKSVSYYVRAVRSGQSGSSDQLVDNGDGTVTDTATGLMWQQGQSSSALTWEAALSYGESLPLAGYDDWRMPTAKELHSIVDYSRSNPAIDAAFFIGTASSEYLSSTTLAIMHSVSGVDFYYGGVGASGKSSSSYVRAVRGGQSQLLGSVIISSPGQADRWNIGEQKTITWDTAGIAGNVKISLSRQGGKAGTFETIVASTENDGTYNWTVTGPNSVNCVLKIEPLNDPSKTTSEGLFSIYGGLYANFTGSGIWKWDGSAWSHLTASAPQDMVISGFILYGDFGSGGIWKWDSATWSQVTASDPNMMVVSGSILYGAFGSGGIWKWDGAAWSQVTASVPQDIVVSGSILYGDFGSGGIWKWDGSAWSQVTASNPDMMVVSGSILYGAFGSGGIWKWDGAAWSQVTASDPDMMAVSGSILYGVFGSGGIWKWDGAAWDQVTMSVPQNIAVSGSLLYGDFGTGGIWKWDGNAWSQVTASDPASMVTGS